MGNTIIVPDFTTGGGGGGVVQRMSSEREPQKGTLRPSSGGRNYSSRFYHWWRGGANNNILKGTSGRAVGNTNIVPEFTTGGVVVQKTSPEMEPLEPTPLMCEARLKEVNDCKMARSRLLDPHKNINRGN